MLPFFRKMRWRLARDNQFFKYSRYAIGEIVLVVIGILIALQINTWNEERKNGLKKITFQKALIEDLKKDTSELKYQINRFERRIESREVFIEKMEKSDASTDSIIRLWISVWRYSIPTAFSPNKSAFESLYSTGYIELFTNEQIALLSSFYKDMEVAYSWIRLGMNDIHEANVELGDKYGFLWKVKKNSHVYKVLRKDIDEKEFLRLLDLAIWKDLQTTERNKSLAEEILVETDSLLKILNHRIE